MKWSLVVQCLSFFFCVYTSTQTEVTCTVPTIENAKTLKKPGTNIEYQCLHGYEPDRFTITCNQQGDWDNMRHCTAKTLDCGPPPSIEHALQVFKEQYKEGETATYVCPSNYVKDGDPYMICSRGRWIGKGKCLQINCLLGPPTPGTSTSPKGKNVFRVGESVEITCSDSHWLYGTREIKRNIICKESGEWEHSPVCEEITCDIPYDQHVDSPHYYFSRDRRLGVEKPYRCESGYRAGARTATCTENGWLPNPLCTEIACPEPTIENARLLDNPQRPYKPGARIRYQCLHGSSRFEITCGWQGEWNNIRPCPGPATCPKPDMVITSGTINEPQKVKDVYTKGDTVEFKCSEGFVFENEAVARCAGREWTYPKCISTTLDCGTPPQIEDAVQDFKDRYEHGEKAAYDCPAFYVKEGDLTCTRGRWAGSGKCWKPCTVDLKAMDDRNIQLRHKYTEKIYSTHGDFIGFSCKSGYRPAEGSVSLRQSCTNGEIPLPVCE
ncbi:complement factor H-related protein 1-like [Colossoma macropomum]|uniref:complement factor H-related protein 1-like n=1 Tax=Colossoma macropomum TaxID=42526 RepID=UPI0018656BB1|nr:complement factor H-related protein 1-like [Colossoma macropomum]